MLFICRLARPENRWQIWFSVGLQINRVNATINAIKDWSRLKFLIAINRGFFGVVSFCCICVIVSDWSGKSVYHGDAVMIVASARCHCGRVWPAVASHVCVQRTHLTVCLLTYLVYKSRYGIWITSLFVGFPCSTVLFLFQFFFHFQFSKSFSSSVMLVPYSYLPHYRFVSRWISLIVIVFFSVFRFHKLLVRMHYTKLAVPVSF